MLKLKHVTKTYKTGDLVQDALKGVSISFRENEFVSILGPSGSGKTTLLNIVGGLDRYTSGDLLINGKSTKDYSDLDWDTYRNHSIGFIFQSYNLIPHQSVLSNVEIALTLAGVSKVERRKRAVEVLIRVGLEDHIHKKPSQMSGGQMQRVAIARALVNNPEILLADEPTGALDSETSVQIMELLEEIAEDRLVIMVTHNPELAEEYSNRIVNIFDGEIVDDSNPYEVADNHTKDSDESKNKVSMSFFTALSLSLSNLATKKGRTILTSFAGSIGIIGIALILSLSTGMRGYILSVEEDTLSSYPINITSQTIDISTVQEDRIEFITSQDNETELDKIYQGGFTGDMMKMQNIQMQNNNLERFKEYLESNDGAELVENTSAILYGYDLDLQVYKKNDDNKDYTKVNPSPLLEQEMDEIQEQMSVSFGMSDNVFSEMIDNQELLQSQYDLLDGAWPTKFNEVVLVVNEDNKISDTTLYALGLKDADEYLEIENRIKDGEKVERDEYPSESFEYKDVLGLQYKLLLNTDYFTKSGDIWTDNSVDQDYLNEKLEDAVDLKIVGILRPSPEATSSAITTSIGYTKDLTNYVIEGINNSDITVEQKDNPDTDIFNNKPFSDGEEVDQSEVLSTLNDAQKAYFMSLSEEERVEFMSSYSTLSKSTYDNNIKTLGIVDQNKPSSVDIYLKNFEARDIVVEAINDYNQIQIDNDNEDYKITYTDFIGMMISSMVSIIDMITYALIGFVSISLVVSSIMIGIITYISVLERVKEIGILRSVGASKKDITRVFNAETLLVGLTSGLIGIGVTILLNIPISMLIKSLSGVSNISALPLNGAIALIIISVVLTTVAGLIPARMASKKDPVEALRSE